MTGWLSNPAIRRFGPASLNQEDQQIDINDILDDLDSWSTMDFDGSSPGLAPIEQDDFVHSFINMDTLGECDSKSAMTHQSPDELESFSMPVSNVYNEVPMNEADEVEMRGLVEELGVTPEQELTKEGITHEVVHAGLHLVHLLLACAEAVGCRDTQLASSLLNQIWASTNPWGDPLQRVSHCFAMGLRSRLCLLHNVGPNGSLANVAVDAAVITREERVEAFHLLHQTTPYIAFGYLAANEAIYQAAQGHDSLHIIDLGMEHELQWSSLIRNLASCPGRPPKLRITGVGTAPDVVDELQASMKSLAKEANFLGMMLEFQTIPQHMTPSLLNPDTLGLKEGESLFVNSIMHLHKYVKESRGSLKAILQAIRKLGPTLFTVVEQDANHNGPFFLGRFLESLHYYSAIFDSLEACLPRPSPVRNKLEKTHFGEEIGNIIAYEGSERVERHERADQWRRQMGRAGFQAVNLKSMSQARLLLSVYGCDGYSLATEKGCLVLGWKGRPIMVASAWQVHNAVSN
ncbi:GRAS family protein RAD1-like [Aristolochia californica]|uniref:GRAS family protein RAD1-like n=1 Tax=Aristolochia californica TaxID=171875 RepID=UPI0035E31712